jgi:alpha,alpha-trehalase
MNHPRTLRSSLLRVAAALLVAAGCRTGTPAPNAGAVAQPSIGLYDPSRALGTLFHDVQMSGIFPDSKTFVDARALQAPSEIAAQYTRERGAGAFNLQAFVEQHFAIPRPVAEGFHSDTTQSMEEHIRALWPALTRPADSVDARSSLVPLPQGYVVPGGRFREVYYWDSYFTMLGLVQSGRTDLVRGMLDNFAHLITVVGHIPNGNRTYYLSRSQPPFFAAMVGLYARATDTTQALRYLDALEKEHAFWMAGADRLTPGQASRRVVRLAGGAILNRYWDDRPEPRPESYRPDYEIGQTVPEARRESFYRNIRASAESGWDFSSRWMRDPKDLRTLETIELVPVDLNSLLYNAERTIAALRAFRHNPGDAEVAARFSAAADARRAALLAAAFDSTRGFFFDVRWRTGERVTDRPTLAAASPLYFGLATPEQGRAVAAGLERELLRPGGFVTTGIASGQQWDAPNGWPPLEWMTIEGVRRYGRADLADTARNRWLALNRRTYQATGKMTEKYDVVDPNRRAGGGEYPTQDGFGWTNGVALALSAQPGAAVSRGSAAPRVAPVLAFPEPGLDDSAAYQGYQTRFYRDVSGNTVQIYLNQREGRVVNLWADAENESLGFTARTARGEPASLHWGDDGAVVSGTPQRRTLEYQLVADAPQVNLGWFLLGTMRVERDFQYWGRHRAPFAGPQFTLQELERMLAALARLDPAEKQRHLALLGAPDEETIRSRLHPTITTQGSAERWVARVAQPSLDGRDTLVLEVVADPRLVIAEKAGDSTSLRARAGERMPFAVRITTSGEALTALTRAEIFTPEFLAFLSSATLAGTPGAPRTAADTSGFRARRLERQVRGVELLSSREKLMAGLPNYATYFGRDMLVSALMMRPIWQGTMSELVIASMLRKLSPLGQVSHEEALGGQAVREGASEYASLVEQHLQAATRGNRAAADSLLARARAVLGDLRRVRENYHMIDDEFQLPVLTARWISDSTVTAEHKRAFLLDASDNGELRVVRMLRELALVARMTAAYVRNPAATNLVSFAPRDSGRWSSASWRDSGEGYGGGRFAMDVNAIWVPHALEATATILTGLRALGISPDSVLAGDPNLRADRPLATFAKDSLALRRAAEVWSGAARHFVVRLSPAQVRSQVTARLAAMPDEERRYWSELVANTKADQDSLTFLALSLDARGRPIGVANSDPATGLFLGELASVRRRPDGAARIRGEVSRDVTVFMRPYPVGLFTAQAGPVVANDAYAPPRVWQGFLRDPYHGPRVVWGREVNLFLLGVTGRIASAQGQTSPNEAALGNYLSELRAALSSTQAAVEASGFHSELWSYRVSNGRLLPVRYGTSSDVQLWSTTSLAVQFALSRLSQ